MRLDIYPAAAYWIGDLEPKRYKQVVSKILALLSDPEPNDSEPLKGYSFRRVDIGEYRIVYSHTKEIVTAVIVGKRNDDEVYKELNRSYLRDKS